MKALVDSNIILDIFENDNRWYNWSSSILDKYSEDYQLFINPVIYTEISIGFDGIELLESSIIKCGFKFAEIPREALFLAEKAFIKYRKEKGNKTMPLPDFYIGAHAAVAGMVLITRDVRRVRHYFPTVKIVSPE